MPSAKLERAIRRMFKPRVRAARECVERAKRELESAERKAERTPLPSTARGFSVKICFFAFTAYSR